MRYPIYVSVTFLDPRDTAMKHATTSEKHLRTMLDVIKCYEEIKLSKGDGENAVG